MSPTRTTTTVSGRVRGRRVAGRVIAGLALVVGAAAPLLAGAGAAPAGAQNAPGVTGTACAPGQGVTVVVDFNGLPGGIRVGCAVGPQANGLAALGAAGFSAGMADGAPGVVCTIAGVPTQGYPYCWLTGGYWSYWRASFGGSWGFSPVGAGGGPLPVDSVEGWSWAPDFASSPPRANETSAPPTTTTTTSTTSTTTTTTTTSTTLSASSSTAPSATTSIAGDTTTAPGGTPSTAPSTGAPSTTAAPMSPVGPSAVAGGTTGHGALPRTGSDTRTSVAVALVLLLAGIALVAGSRRLAAVR